MKTIDTRLLSLFRRALVLFHGFSVLVFDLWLFKRACLEFDWHLIGPGRDRALRTSYDTCVESLFRLMAELCHTLKVLSYVTVCSVLVLTQCSKNELCYIGSVLDSTFRLMLHVKRASLDLGLKERVMLHVRYACVDS